MIASRTTPTLCVLVMATGPSSRPLSWTHVVPVISPLPFSVNQAANTGSGLALPRGWTTVTPVRTGPLPTTSVPLPEMSVVCPTSTPATSVIALSGPGVPPIGSLSSCSRGFLALWASGTAGRARNANTIPRATRIKESSAAHDATTKSVPGRYNEHALCGSHRARGLAFSRSSMPLAPVVWARSIAPAIRSSTVMWRSRSCPTPLTSDPERLARFRREAQMLAAVNHPNIAHIHGFEDGDGVHALVMELVDGPTLTDRIASGRIALTEALSIALSIAEALQAAHGQGIIHRDLKPGNVKIADDGVVKLLDFGLAKTAENPAGGADYSASPTFTNPAMTQAGVILGTAAYMSPEQAKGRRVDKRTDVFAFGAVFYEMLTGRRAFAGDDVTDVLASVLKSDPEWTAMPDEVPASIRMLIRRCLAKDVRQRVGDISTAVYVIADSTTAAADSTAGGASAIAPHRSGYWLQLAIAVAISLIVGAIGAAMWPRTQAAQPRVSRFALTPSDEQTLQVDPQSTDVMVTPDGTHVIYKGGADSAATQLFVRSLDQLESAPLTPPGAPKAPFSSPDGQWVGFFEPGAPVRLNKVAITGGPAITLTAVDGASRGATWGDDDRITFATTAPSTGLQQVSAAGGEPTVLTKPDPERGEADHVYPQWLPGGEALLFTITSPTGNADAAQVAVLDVRTRESKVIVRGGSQAFYVPSGHLVYVAAGTLRAVRFDLDRHEVMGTAVPVVSPLVILPTGAADFDIGRDGTLAYVVGGTAHGDGAAHAGMGRPPET